MWRGVQKYLTGAVGSLMLLGVTAPVHAARFYSPALGRFMQRDTVETEQAFAYVNNNPLLASDPSGHLSAFHMIAPDGKFWDRNAFESAGAANQQHIFSSASTKDEFFKVLNDAAENHDVITFNGHGNLDVLAFDGLEGVGVTVEDILKSNLDLKGKTIILDGCLTGNGGLPEALMKKGAASVHGVTVLSGPQQIPDVFSLARKLVAGEEGTARFFAVFKNAGRLAGKVGQVAGNVLGAFGF